MSKAGVYKQNERRADTRVRPYSNMKTIPVRYL